MTDKLSVHIYLFFNLPNIQCIEPLCLLLLILKYTSTVCLFICTLRQYAYNAVQSMMFMYFTSYFHYTVVNRFRMFCLNVDFSRLWMLQIFSWTGPVEITVSSVFLNVVTCDRRLIIPFRYGPLKHPSSIPQHLKHLFDIGCDGESWKFDMLCCRSLMLRKQNVLPWIAVMYIHTKEVGSFTLEIKVISQ